MTSKMWEILTTLTEETQRAVEAKCKELGFDPNRGVVSLEESFENLAIARSILMDAIEQQKLVHLPISVQTTLVGHLEAIYRFQTGLINGADEVVNLVNAIEQLNAAIWQYGLHNLSGEVLGYQTKLNQLKNQDIELKRLKGELENGLRSKVELERLVGDAKSSTDALRVAVDASEESAKKIAENVALTTEADQKTAAILATIQQNEGVSTQLLATTKTSNAEVTAVEGRIKEFHSQIDQFRTQMLSTKEDAENAVRSNNAKTGELISKLGELEDQIKVQIQKATGYSLFHSFQTRQEALIRSRRAWAIALGVLVVVSLALTIFVMTTTTSIDVAFWVKLSLSVPIIFAIVFSTAQYSRERRLEEEYAFKASISISLVPYQELVEKVVGTGIAADKANYTAFLIDSIGKVFTSPTARVFEGEERQKGLSVKVVRQLTPLIEAVAKGLKP